MHDGGVIAATKVATNFTETEPGVLSGEIHANLPRKRNALVPPFGKQISKFESVIPRNSVQNVLNGQLGRPIQLHLIPNRLLRECKIDVYAIKHRHGLDLGDGTFNLSDIGVDSGGNVSSHIIRQFKRSQCRLGFHDRDAGFIARPLNIGDQPTPKPASETFFEIRNFIGRRI